MISIRLIAAVLIGLLALVDILIGIRVLSYEFGRRRREKVAEQYDELICKYLAPADKLVPFTFPGLSRKVNREVLVSRIYTLTTHLTGVEKRMLVLMFRSNSLYMDIFSKYTKGSKNRLCKVLFLFNEIPAPNYGMFRIGHHMYSEDRNVRLFALIAYFNHDPKKVIPMLKSYPYDLAPRDFANIYAFISSNSVPMHNVELLLDSKNKTVALFGEKLMKIYGMKPVNHC